MNQIERIKQVLYGYVYSGLIEGNAEKVLSFVSDDIIGFGIGEQGFVNSKQKIREIMIAGIKEAKTANIKYDLQFEDIKIHLITPDTACLCAQIIVYCSQDGVTTKSGMMQSLTLKQIDDNWLICALHASPTMLTEECITAYPFHYAENTIAHLKEELQSETFELINQSIPGGILCIVATPPDFPLYFINDSMLEYIGYSREEFLCLYQNSVIEIVHPLDREKISAIFMEALHSGKDYKTKVRIIKKDKSILWMVVHGRKTVDDKGHDIILGVLTDVTELILLQNELEEQTKALSISEERFRIALEKTTNIIFDYDLISGNIMHSSAPKKAHDYVTNISDACETLIIGGTVTEESMEDFQNAFLAMHQGAAQSDCIVKIRMVSGIELWNRISITSVTDENGVAVRAIGMIEDITKQKEAELAYSREEQYRQAILSDALAIYTINFSTCKYESCQIIHPNCISIEPGTPYNNNVNKLKLYHLLGDESTILFNNFSIENIMNAFEKGTSEIKYEFYVHNSATWIQIMLRLVLDTTTNEKKGFLYITDIDERKRIELALQEKAQKDSLTGAYNKAAAEEKIKECLKTQQEMQISAFMMIDVDKFKDINDNYGHPFGDHVLKDANIGINSVLKKDAIVARFGGDEFAVFISNAVDQSFIEQTATAICNVFRNLFVPKEGNAIPSCSIGITVCENSSKSFEQIYNEADEALYRAKKAGRNCFKIYN